MFASPDDDDDDKDDTPSDDGDDKSGDSKDDDDASKGKKGDLAHIALKQAKSHEKELRKLRRELAEIKQQVAKGKAIDTKNGDDGSDQDAADDAARHDDIKPGENATIDRLKKDIANLQKKVDQESSARVKAERDHKVSQRRHVIESALAENGAVKPAQVRSLIESELLVEDQEIGDAIKVKTESGEDLVPIKDVKTWLFPYKEENPHLFTPPAKSGSGAGAGGHEGVKPKLATPEKLADPKKGGMDQADYEKNREKIHAELEREAGIGK